VLCVFSNVCSGSKICFSDLETIRIGSHPRNMRNICTFCGNCLCAGCAAVIAVRRCWYFGKLCFNFSVVGLPLPSFFFSLLRYCTVVFLLLALQLFDAHCSGGDNLCWKLCLTVSSDRQHPCYWTAFLEYHGFS